MHFSECDWYGGLYLEKFSNHSSSLYIALYAVLLFLSLSGGGNDDALMPSFVNLLQCLVIFLFFFIPPIYLLQHFLTVAFAA